MPYFEKSPMKGKYLKKFSFVKPGYLTFIALFVAVILIFPSYFELQKNKEEIYRLLNEFSASLIYTISVNSSNTILSEQEIDNLLTNHLLGVARTVKRLDSISVLTDEDLEKIARESDVYRINIFDKKGTRIISNMSLDTVRKTEHKKQESDDYIMNIIEGKDTEIIIGLKEAKYESGNRFAVAVSRAVNKGGVIVVNVDADSFVKFKNEIGFRKLIVDVSKLNGIVYVVLQDEEDLLAANKVSVNVTEINKDEFLKIAYNSDSIYTRVIEYYDEKVFEAVKTLKIEGEKIGLLRAAISMEEVTSLEGRMLRRILIITGILVVIAIIVLGVAISSQNYRILSGEYEKIKTFTGNILDNISYAVITIDNNENIKIFNKNAGLFFGVEKPKVIGKNIYEIFKDKFSPVTDLFKYKQPVNNRELEVEKPDGNVSIVNVSSSVIITEKNEIDSFTIVLNDITDLKILENQVKQQEKSVAMGELAAGVAHEIKNPLNSINMIAQRYQKEFGEMLKSEDFEKMNKVLRTESERVNRIVNQFLEFAKPSKLNYDSVSVTGFVNDAISVFAVEMKLKGIRINVDIEKEKQINVDYEKFKQVFVNILKNSIEAVEKNGEIYVIYKIKRNLNIFEITDNGQGITVENLNKIFDLYFSTKKNGTGLGLPISQHIIFQHKGKIFVRSQKGQGTKFVIEIP